MIVQAAADRADYEDPRITRSRALIMSAAARVFLLRGYPGTSVDDIAVEAGVSKRTVYNVFDDKEQLFRAIIGDAIATAERFSAELVATTAEAAGCRGGAHDARARAGGIRVRRPRGAAAAAAHRRGAPVPRVRRSSTTTARRGGS